MENKLENRLIYLEEKKEILRNCIEEFNKAIDESYTFTLELQDKLSELMINMLQIESEIIAIKYSK